MIYEYYNRYLYLGYLHTKASYAQGRQVRAHLLNGRILGLTLDHRGRAHLTGARCGGSTLGGLRALDFGAAGARAGRALTLGFGTLGAIQNGRHGFRDRALEYIVAQVRYRRALGLEHVLAHVWHCGAGRHCGF